METLKHCAYNQTRDSILGLDVAAADFSRASLDDWIPTLTPKSGAGLWMVPFRGIPAKDVHVPLDLVYMDEHCSVIDVVRSFPKFNVSPSSRHAASVLALPSQSIESSRTQPGDQLLVCRADEIEWRLKDSPGARAFGAIWQGSAPMQEKPFWDPASKKPGWIDGPMENGPEPQPRTQIQLVEAVAQATKRTKKWWERWLSPEPKDPRRGAREPLTGLAAYFFTGGPPQAHQIRDISPTGLFVVTEERWYPGTQIRMTLTKASLGGTGAERSISLLASAVRWGNDGVGLRFVLPESQERRRGQDALIAGVDREDLEQFLKRVRNGRD
jgi:hypothetical protein